MSIFLKTLNEKFGEKGMKLGLATMMRLDAYFDFPSKKFQSIHVGGTNGKGSVTTKIAACLEKSGHKVGLYTSPHISSYCERIKIDGVMIAQEEAVKHFEEMFAAAKQLELKPTFFECMTLLSFLYFAKNACDFACIEVGMGGRFDATNIIEPNLSIITTLEYDHTKYLGESLEKIAFEKAGIIKEKIPLLVGPKARLQSIFRNTAAEKNSPYFELEGDFDDFEEENRAIAQKALQLLGFHDFSGLELTPPCRFEIFEKEVPIVLDVAHNGEGFLALIKRLNQKYPKKKKRLLMGLGGDKEVERVFDILVKHFDSIHLTEAINVRVAPVEDLEKQLQKRHFLNFSIKKDVLGAFREAQSLAIEHNEVLVVAGTFYIMSVVRKELGVEELCDDFSLTPY